MSWTNIFTFIKIAIPILAAIAIFIQHEENSRLKEQIEYCHKQTTLQNANILQLQLNSEFLQKARDKLEKKARENFEKQQQDLLKTDTLDSVGTSCEDARKWGIEQGMRF